MILETLRSGQALNKFRLMLVEQGVTEDFASGYCNNDSKYTLATASYKTKVKVIKAGYIADIDALELATCCWNLGAGRTNPGDPVDHRVGIELLKVVGDFVENEAHWAIVHHSTVTLPTSLLEQMQKSIIIADTRQESAPAIIKTVSC